MVHPRVLEMSGIDPSTVYSGRLFDLVKSAVMLVTESGFYQVGYPFSEQFS